jgi:hypothetical protein
MKYSIIQADTEFKEQFEACKFPASEFDHRAHIRLAYIYLVENQNVDKAIELMRNSIIRLLNHIGVEPGEKYHETLTEAWILAVHHFMNKTGTASCADDFIDQNTEMLDSKIMLTHYSAELLFSQPARQTFIEPDKDPIPRYQSAGGSSGSQLNQNTNHER